MSWAAPSQQPVLPSSITHIDTIAIQLDRRSEIHEAIRKTAYNLGDARSITVYLWREESAQGQKRKFCIHLDGDSPSSHYPYDLGSARPYTRLVPYAAGLCTPGYRCCCGAQAGSTREVVVVE